MENKPKVKNKEKHDIIGIIKQCAKSNVKKIKVGDIEIEFNTSEQEKPEVTTAVSEDPEFNEEAKKHQKEIDEFNEEIIKENEVLINFDAHEEREIMKAIGAGNAD